MGRESTPPDVRFAAKTVHLENGCIEWTGSKNDTGYGTFYAGTGSYVMAHRWSYQRLFGQIPEGCHLDHLCRNRACVNPKHLEVVTPRENLLRGFTITAANAAKADCPSGHPYSGDNLYVPPGTSDRKCRACSDARNRARRRTKKAA